MKPLFALFVAGYTFMVVAAGAVRAWRIASSPSRFEPAQGRCSSR